MPETIQNGMRLLFYSNFFRRAITCSLGSVYIFFETPGDKVKKFTSNMGNTCVLCPVAFGGTNRYYLGVGYFFISYHLVQDNGIRKKISEMDVS